VDEKQHSWFSGHMLRCHDVQIVAGTCEAHQKVPLESYG
jgi:hypothetical protein